MSGNMLGCFPQYLTSIYLNAYLIRQAPFFKSALGVGGFWDAAILTHPPETETGAQHLHIDKGKENAKLKKRRSSQWHVAKEIRYS